MCRPLEVEHIYESLLLKLIYILYILIVIIVILRVYNNGLGNGIDNETQIH